MADSPLSIISSVAGILTFIAAIFAFVYVRYQIMHNGHEEMITILESVRINIEETNLLVTTIGSGEIIGSELLRKLMQDLYTLELEILTYYAGVFGIDYLNIPPNLRSEVNQLTDAWAQAQDEQQRPSTFDQQKRPNFEPLRKLAWRIFDRMCWAYLTFVFNALIGNTPKLLRWYLVRDEVLERTRRREIIQSRLLFHQITLANIQVQAYINENAKLQLLLRETVNANTEIKDVLLEMMPRNDTSS